MVIEGDNREEEGGAMRTTKTSSAAPSKQQQYFFIIYILYTIPTPPKLASQKGQVQQQRLCLSLSTREDRKPKFSSLPSFEKVVLEEKPLLLLSPSSHTTSALDRTNRDHAWQLMASFW